MRIRRSEMSRRRIRYGTLSRASRTVPYRGLYFMSCTTHLFRVLILFVMEGFLVGGNFVSFHDMICSGDQKGGSFSFSCESSEFEP